MTDNRDVDAAEWLQWSLRGALSRVGDRQSRVDAVRDQLDEAVIALGEAVAIADAIRLIISMAPLPLVEAPNEGSAKPADKQATPNRKGNNVAQTDDD